MLKDIYLFNTLSRAKEKFTSLEPGKVKLYTCGPTVYHYAHIGNMRTFIFEDILVRALRFAGYEVTHVMNITDVGHLVSDADEGEDRMEKGSRREGKTAWQIAEFYTQAFFQDMDKLNLLRPQIIPRATDHIQEMIDLVLELEKRGYIYRTDDGIYFDTAKFANYGKLARLDIENLEAGKRVAMREKHNPTDFALWKFSSVGERRQMEWESPWGKGFPGWHIECSAMSMKYLGHTLDIHCGGKDHIPVHHTNEIAQSEAATGEEFSRFWMHGEFLTEDKGKISKSKDTVLTLSYLMEQGFEPMDYRFLLLQAHYRTELNFHYEAMKSARAGLQGIRNRFQDWKNMEAPAKVDSRVGHYRQEFSAAILDDLNTPIAVSVLFEVLRDSQLLDNQKKLLVLEFDSVLGLRLENDIMNVGKGEVLPGDIAALVADRDQARFVKNWQESDRIRDLLLNKGYAVLDTPTGTRVTKK